MYRLLPFVAAVGLALLAPAVYAKTVIVTDSRNKQAVTLVAGDTLVVRLTAKTGLGATQWHVVYDPEMLVQLSSKPGYFYPPNPHSIVVAQGGGPNIQEFRFTVPPSKESFVKGAWLRFLSLSPFEPGVKNARLWEIQYTVKAAKQDYRKP